MGLSRWLSCVQCLVVVIVPSLLCCLSEGFSVLRLDSQAICEDNDSVLCLKQRVGKGGLTL